MILKSNTHNKMEKTKTKKYIFGLIRDGLIKDRVTLDEDDIERAKELFYEERWNSKFDRDKICLIRIKEIEDK